MKKTRLEKGITLIALIITIVILLILAVVTIGAIRDDGIIKHAQSSAKKHTIGDEKETIQLAHAEYVTAKYLPLNQVSDSTDNIDKEGLETFFLGKDIRTLVNETDGVYVIDYNENEKIKINTSDLKTSEDGKEVYVDFEYNGNTYRLTVDSSNFVSKSLEVMTLEKFFLGKNIGDLINDGKSTSEVLVIDYFGNEININIDELEINDAKTEMYAYFDYEGIRYKLILDSNAIIQKVEAISNVSELKVEGADVKGNEKKGWIIRFSDTGNRYTLSSDGTLSEPEKTVDLVEGSLAKAYVDGELKIGDMVGYKPESGKSITIAQGTMGNNKDITISTDKNLLGWQVMDVNDATGVVTLISSSSIRTSSNSSDCLIGGKNGYKNGPNTLHQMCSVFGTGNGATSARSLTLEDILKVFQLDKTTIEDSNNGHKNEDPVRNRIYGDKLTYYSAKTTWNPIDAYSFADSRTEYTRTGNNITFKDINGNVATDDKPIALTDTACYLSYNSIFTVSGDIKKMIFGSNDSGNSLLATSVIEAELDSGKWSIQYNSGYAIRSVNLYTSDGKEHSMEQSYTNYYYTSIRPVVELKANVLAEKDANGVWQLK